MPNEKKKVGRPRKYTTQSERQKAYHERKKQRMASLEKKIEILEREGKFSSGNQIEISDDFEFRIAPNFQWNKITPGEIALMGTQELEFQIKEFRKRIYQQDSLEISLENITLGIISKNNLLSKIDTPIERIEEINQEIDLNIKNLEERMQQQTLLYLMEAELANRERLDGRKSKLDLFEARIDELEKNNIDSKIAIKKKIEK